MVFLNDFVIRYFRTQYNRGINRAIPFAAGGGSVLWTIFVILLILWLVGFIGFHVIAWYIHLLLVVALVVLIIQLISGRRPIP
jgi:hypothetical protein